MESQGGFKYNIIWAVIGVIAILVTVKELGFTPTKITTPGVSVELKGGGGIDPKAADGAPPPADNTAELTKRVKELESQLKSGQGAEHSVPVDTAANSGRPANANPPADAAPMANVGGRWVGPVMLNITQNGSSIVTKMADAYGNLLSVGQGTVNGRNVSVQYLNNFYVPGNLTATVSADGRQMDVTDFGKGSAQHFFFSRQ